MSIVISHSRTMDLPHPDLFIDGHLLVTVDLFKLLVCCLIQNLIWKNVKIYIRF